MLSCFRDPRFHIVEDIHEVDVAVVWGVVGGEVFVDIAVGPVLGAHVVEVVACGEFAPVVDDVFHFDFAFGIAGCFDFDEAFFDCAFDFVGFFEGVVLHVVAAPCGEVAFGVGPRDELGDVVDSDGVESFECFTWRDEVIFGGAVLFVGDIEDCFGEFFHEVEDAGVFPLVFTEGFVVHEEVAEVSVAVDVVDPLGEFFGGEWPLFPSLVGEAECDVVGELVVFEEESEGAVVGSHEGLVVVAVGWAVDVVGGAVSEVAVGSFADGSEESWVAFFVFDFGEGFGEFVGVDQLGVSEHGWRLSEVFFDELGVHVHLVGELFLGVDVAEGVEVGLGDELAASCFSKLDEEVEDIGAELFPLVDDGSGDRVGEAEVSLVSFDEVEHELGGWAVALVGDLVADFAVGVFVEVEGVGVEDGVWLEAVWLVDLEVEVDGCHGFALRLAPLWAKRERIASAFMLNARGSAGMD